MEILEEILRRDLSSYMDSEKLDEVIDLIIPNIETHMNDMIELEYTSRCEIANEDSIDHIEDLKDSIVGLEKTIIELEEEVEECYDRLPIDTLEDEMKLKWIRENWHKIDAYK
jgi:hypothetical protein